MYVAVGQFAVTPDWNENAEKCVSLMHQAKQKGRRCWYFLRRYWPVMMAIQTCR